MDDNEIWFGMKDIIVTTYETVASIENYFGRMFWKAVILDEARRGTVCGMLRASERE